jgi:hypothetical protein
MRKKISICHAAVAKQYAISLCELQAYQLSHVVEQTTEQVVFVR